jgi:hypothetical protein
MRARTRRCCSHKICQMQTLKGVLPPFLTKSCLQSMQPEMALTGQCTLLDALSPVACCSTLSRTVEHIHTSEQCTVSHERWITHFAVWNLFGRVFKVCQPFAASLQYVICCVSDLWLQVFTCIETMYYHHICRPILPRCE